MSGQCFGCGTEFGRFKKEHGCKNCGFAFCNKCFGEKSIPVPKKNNTKHHVCHKCFKILTGAASQSTEVEQYDLPEAYLKRIAALKAREAGGQSSHAVHSSGGGNVLPEHLHRLDKADRDIAVRLEKLKSEDKPKEKVSDSDIQRRLAQLKGQHDVPEPKPMYKPPDRRSETQQVDDLIEQLIAEVDLDCLRPDPAQEVAARLANFHQGEESKPINDKHNLSHNFDNGATDGNDLNKVDKMGSMVRGHSQDGRNIQLEKAGTPASGGDEVDLEEIKRLMSQTSKEVELDAQRALKGVQQDVELMSRLRELQKQRAKIAADSDTMDSDADNTTQSGNAAISDDDDEDDDVGATKLVQQYLDEATIDVVVRKTHSKKDKPTLMTEAGNKKRNTDSPPTSGGLKPSNLEPPGKEVLTDSDYDDADELPYCCMCTEDATLRCLDCDMDLYCRPCFKGCHQDMQITDHRTTPYTAPKGYH